MVGKLRQRLDRIESKAQLLASLHSKFLETRRADTQRIEDLVAKEKQQNAEIARLRTEVEFLTVSHSVVPNRDDIASSRAMLAELVREIDRCIADIGE